MGNKRWPVTVTFAVYFDHEPDGRQRNQIMRWAEHAYDQAPDYFPEADEVAFSDVKAGPPVDNNHYPPDDIDKILTGEG